jgi:hydrophobic/amphiphilic exporter-1 (mainly G- bacteria), HAE1 family
MSLTSTSVYRPIGTGILCAAAMLLGLVSVNRLAVDLLPEVDFPRISITTSYPGVGPEEIETLITRPIEQTVSTVEGIEEITAVSAEGLSRVQLRFAWGTDLETAVNDVRSYLDRLRNRLPDDADNPVIYKFDLASMPVATVGVSGGGDPRRLRHLAEENVSQRLERIPGVASASVMGGRVREIRVELDGSRLTSLGVTAREVSDALARDNRNVSAGEMVGTGREVLVRTVGEWSSPDEIENVLVGRRDGRPVYVRDVGDVLDTMARVRSEQWVNGEPGITLRVTKQPDANTIDVVADVRAEVDRINRDYEGQLRADVLFDSSEFIKSAVTNVQSSALYGAGLAVFVLFLFLRNFRATAIIALAIPLSVVSTFTLMYFAGYTLNVISFGGLALGIGMLVDNAIVILENIYRRRELGQSPVSSAIEGAHEVGPAVIAGTLTTIAVFAPVLFIGDFAGVFFGEMAAVVAFALVCSLVVALTLIPSLAARFVRSPGDAGPGGGLDRIWASLRRGGDALGRGGSVVERGYTRLIQGALRTPWFVVACAILLLVASIRLVPAVGFELMPETDEGQINISVELPVGTPLAETTALVRSIEQSAGGIARPGEIDNIISSAGPTNWWRPGGTHEGSVQLRLVPVQERARGIDEIMAELRSVFPDVPGASIRMRKGSSNMLMRLMRGGAGDGERLVVEVRGHDLEVAADLAERVELAMRGIEGIADVRVDRDEGLEERSVRVDAARAADLGLTRAEVAETVETYVLGRVATRLRERGDEYDVRVQLRERDRVELDQLHALPIITADGRAVPLASIAELGARRGPTSIARDGQERVVRVFGGLADRPLSEAVTDLRRAIDQIERPEGFNLAIAGEHQEQEETFGGLLIGIILAILLVYAVMAVQFESVRHPLVIMVAVPFGFIGVVLALVVTGTTFNMNSFLGAIVLVGISVNNAIVLVHYMNVLRREQDYELFDAVVSGARRRLRPILMTTMTTALAMMPLALGLGAGSEIQAPLARVVVGGLLASTLVTLVLVPTLYYLMERRRANLSSLAAE